jgi:hypothetical protein
MGTWIKSRGKITTLAGCFQRHATLLPASQREHAGVQTRTMVTSLSAKTESNDDACDNDDDACTLSVHELSLDQPHRKSRITGTPQSILGPIGTTEGALVQEQRAKRRAALGD